VDEAINISLQSNIFDACQVLVVDIEIAHYLLPNLVIKLFSEATAYDDIKNEILAVLEASAATGNLGKSVFVQEFILRIWEIQQLNEVLQNPHNSTFLTSEFF